MLETLTPDGRQKVKDAEDLHQVVCYCTNCTNCHACSPLLPFISVYAHLPSPRCLFAWCTLLSKQFCWMYMLQGETVKFCQSSLAVIQDMLLTVEVANLRRISSFLKEHSHPPPAEASAESIIRSVQGPGGAAKLLKSMTAATWASESCLH